MDDFWGVFRIIFGSTPISILKLQVPLRFFEAVHLEWWMRIHHQRSTALFTNLHPFSWHFRGVFCDLSIYFLREKIRFKEMDKKFQEPENFVWKFLATPKK